MNDTQLQETLNQFLNYELLRLGSFKLTPKELIAVVLIVLITRAILWTFRRFLTRQEKRRKLDSSSAYTFYQLFKYLAFVIAFGMSLEALGIQLNILLASTAALFVGIGLGLQHLFDDFISGIIILIDRTIKVGDIIQVENTVGRVISIRMRLTEVESRDHIHLLIPNSLITSNKVVNYTHQTAQTRFDIVVGVAYDSDTDLVKQILLDCAHAHSQVVKDPPPQVWLIDFADSALQFRLLFYSDEVFRIERVRSDLRYMIVERFRQRGITIPFPQRDVYIKTQS
ncbi:mechanosensitive ion channel [Nibrella viscosa]|uniref:Mechanosensitive ion channel n=1 Tax=Nibrella viscosa TaxID=1084524 RepID=A0ABP8K484_9BACT